MKRYKIIVAGRVQGVGFRFFVQKQAQLNCIKGFVRNLSDGNVEIDAEGNSTNLQLFLDQCKQGPAHSLVEFFTKSEVPIWGYQNFNIR